MKAFFNNTKANVSAKTKALVAQVETQPAAQSSPVASALRLARRLGYGDCRAEFSDLRLASVGLVMILALLFSCRPPLPRAEPPRLPVILSGDQYGSENSPFAMSLVTHMPDPRYQADRLDASRYEAGTLTFSCLDSCPDGLFLNSETGEVTWTPGFGDAGLYQVTFGAKSGIYSSETAVPIFISFIGRPPIVPTGGVTLSAKEGEELRAQLHATSPDGDTVRYTCLSGCPAGMTVEGGGAVSWSVPYLSHGSYRVRVRGESSPNARRLKFRGTRGLEDTPEFIGRVEPRLIDRSARFAADFDVAVSVAYSPRPVELFPVAAQSVTETEKLSFTVVAKDPDLTTLNFKCDSSCPRGVTVDPVSGLVEWVPEYGQRGSYSISIEVIKDGRVDAVATVGVEVAKKYRPPYFSSETPPQSVAEASLLTFTLPGRTDDPEETLSYSCLSACPPGLTVEPTSGVVAWRPDYGQSSLPSVSSVFGVSDGVTTVTQTVPVAVTFTNRPPSFTSVPPVLSLPAGMAFRHTLEARDPDQSDTGRLRFECLSGCPQGLSVGAVSGQLQWLPSYGQSGDHDALFQVTDSYGAAARVAVRFTVTKVAHAPKFLTLLSVSGVALQPLSFALQAVQVDGDKVTYACKAACPLGLSLDAESGLVSWTPAANQSGTFLVTFSASSSPAWDPSVVKTAETTVTVYVQKFNKPPEIKPLADLGLGLVLDVNEGGHETASYLSPRGPGLRFKLEATDPNGDLLTYACTANCPSGLSVSMMTGEVVWLPGYGQARPLDAAYEGIEFSVSDGDYLVRAPPVSIRVHRVLRPPVVEDLPGTDFAVYEAGHLSGSSLSPKSSPLSFAIKATDPQGQTLNYSCVENCPPGLRVDAAGGSVSWTPAYCRPGESGCTPKEAQNTGALPNDAAYSGIVFRVASGGLSTLTKPISIKVLNVARPPVVSPLNSFFSINEGGHATASFASPVGFPLGFTVSAVSPDGATLSYACTLNCPPGLAVEPTLGQVSWTPAYCSPGERGPAGACLPADSSNVGAKVDGGAYAGIVFSATDAGGLSTPTSPVTVAVGNVDRPPEAAAPPGPVRVAEGEFASASLGATDPDGDTVSYQCVDVTAAGEGRGETEACLQVVGQGSQDITYLYPRTYGSANSGRTQWLRLSAASGVVTLGSSAAPVGYFDALRHNAPYRVTWSLTSRPEGFSAFSPAPALVTRLSQDLVIVNTDRPAPVGSAPVGVVPCPDPLTPLPTPGFPCGFGPYVVSETASPVAPSAADSQSAPAVIFNLANAGDDPDSRFADAGGGAGGSLGGALGGGDAVEYVCDPTIEEITLPGGTRVLTDGCPPELTIQQHCGVSGTTSPSGLCSYAENPLGCPSGSAGDGRRECMGGLSKGRVTFTPRWTTPKKRNEPYYIKFLAVSTPDGFDTTDTPPYPPLKAEATVAITVNYAHHPPAFTAAALSPCPAGLTGDYPNCRGCPAGGVYNQHTNLCGPLPGPLPGGSIAAVTPVGTNLQTLSVPEPCGDPPANPLEAARYVCTPKGKTYAKSFLLSALSPDSAYFQARYGPTQEEPTYALLGCWGPDVRGTIPPDGPTGTGTCPPSGLASPPKDLDTYTINAGSAGCLAACPLTGGGGGTPLLTLSGNTVTVASLSNSDALALPSPEAPRRAFFSAKSCPLETTGWECGSLQSTTVSLSFTVTNEARGPTTAVIEAAPSGSPSPGGSSAGTLDLSTGRATTDETVPLAFSLSSSVLDPEGEAVIFCALDGGAVCPSGLSPTYGARDGVDPASALALSNVTLDAATGGLSVDGAAADEATPLLYRATVFLPASQNISRDRVNRRCTPLRATMSFLACSSPEAFGAPPPSCPKVSTGSRSLIMQSLPTTGLAALDQRCSVVGGEASPGGASPGAISLSRTVSLEIADLDRPPTMSLYLSAGLPGSGSPIRPLGASFKENSPADSPVITVHAAVRDPDEPDNTTAALAVRPANWAAASGMVSPAVNPSGFSTLALSDPLAPCPPTLCPASLYPNSPGGVWTTSFQNDWSVNPLSSGGAGQGYATRAQPAVGFAPAFELCYADTGDGAPFSGMCHSPVAAANFSVLDSPRQPYFLSLTPLFGHYDCTDYMTAYNYGNAYYYTAGSGSGGGGGGGCTAITPSSPQKAYWEEVDQAGFFGLNLADVDAGKLAFSVATSEPADQLGGTFTVRECPGSDARLGSAAVVSSADGSPVAARWLWDDANGRGYGTLSGAAPRDDFYFRPCLMICRKNDLANCTKLAPDAEGHVNYYTVGSTAGGTGFKDSPVTAILFKDTNRPPSLLDLSFGYGNANSCNDLGGVTADLLARIQAGDPLYSDPDGDLFSGLSPDVFITENPGSPRYVTNCVWHGLTQDCQNKIGCDADFSYQIRVGGQWSNPATLSTYAGHQKTCLSGFLCY